MTTGFFGTGTAATTNPATAFSTPTLFPSSTAATTTMTGPPAGTGLFGTGMQQPSTGFGTGGLFAGNPTLNPPAASTSSGFSVGSAGTLFTTTTVPTTTPAFFGFGTSTPPTTKSTFGLPATTSAPVSTGGFFGFGGAQPAAPLSTGFGPASTTTTGLFSGLSLPSTAASAPSSLGFMTTAAPVTTTTSIGLGGVDLAHSTPGLAGGSVVSKSDNKAVKEILVPQEIVQTVEAYKKYVKDQKSIREEITRISAKPLNKVQEETTSLKNLLSVVSNAIQRNVAVVDKLKRETAQELKNAEIAQRTKDTPHALQYENVAPTQYFHNLVETFELKMKLFRIKIDQMEKYLSHSQSIQLTPQEFAQLMKQLHQTFVTLAAELQSIHEAVKLQKEHYMNYRKIFYGDTKEPFKETPPTPYKEASALKLPTTMGPTPFSSTSSAAAMAMASAFNKAQQPPTANAPPMLGLNSSTGLSGLGGFGSSGGMVGSSFSFGTSTVKPLGSFDGALGSGSVGFDTGASLGGSFGYSHSAPATPLYQKPLLLQKPPLGNKRGKRVAHN